MYATGPVSGGHLNPAVTMAMVVSKKIKMAEAINYWVAQLLGAIIGALVYRLISGTTMSIMPGDGVALWKAGLVEVIFTFMLAMVVYMTAVTKKAEGNSYRGLAIGLTVFVGAVAVGKISGGAFNTAVSTGSILVDWMNNGSIAYLWMYLIATLLGGAIAGYVAPMTETREHR